MIYRYLKDTLAWPDKSIIGNAFETVEYVANGEASDWMFGAKKIIAYSPELGEKEKYSENFWVDPKWHREILMTDYKLIESFIEAHHIKLDLVRISLPEMHTKNMSEDQPKMFLGVNEIKFPHDRMLRSQNSEEIGVDKESVLEFLKNLDKTVSDSKPEFYYVFFNRGINNFRDLKLKMKLGSESGNFLKNISTANYQFADIQKYLSPGEISATLEVPNRTDEEIQKYFFGELADSIPMEKLNYEKSQFIVEAPDIATLTTSVKLEGVHIDRFSYFIIKFEMTAFTLTRNFSLEILKKGLDFLEFEKKHDEQGFTSIQSWVGDIHTNDIMGKMWGMGMNYWEKNAGTVKDAIYDPKSPLLEKTKDVVKNFLKEKIDSLHDEDFLDESELKFNGEVKPVEAANPDAKLDVNRKFKDKALNHDEPGLWDMIKRHSIVFLLICLAFCFGLVWCCKRGSQRRQVLRQMETSS